MQNDWMIHVLKDLRTFAELNGLDDLAGKLAEAGVIAKGAMSALEPQMATGRVLYAETAGDAYRSPRRCI